METLRCVITGALGNVGYHTAFLAASGAFVGENTKIELHLLEIPEMKNQLQGLRMEIEDCAFPSLSYVKVGVDPFEMFEGVDCAFLIGAQPRSPGMERKDLLHINGSIFFVQGRALDRVAKKDVHVLVVGNPCNTNCLIALHNAPTIDPSRFSSMMFLDEQRARALVARRAQVSINEVSSVTIWGNHSPTLVADTTHTMIKGTEAHILLDSTWRHAEFSPTVRNRGSEVLKARGKSSAASAAVATIGAMKALMGKEEKEISLGVYTRGNQYGIDQDLVFSFPCIASQRGYSVLPSRKPDEILWKEVLLSEKELQEERDAIRNFLNR